MSPPATLEVEDGLDAVGLDRRDLGDAAERPEPVAGLEVAGHDPALAGLPEPVDAGGHDRLLAQADPVGRVGRVVVDRDDRLVAEGPGGRVLGQDQVAVLELLDRPGAVERADRGPGPEAGVPDRDLDCWLTTAEEIEGTA